MNLTKGDNLQQVKETNPKDVDVLYQRDLGRSITWNRLLMNIFQRVREVLYRYYRTKFADDKMFLLLFIALYYLPQLGMFSIFILKQW